MMAPVARNLKEDTTAHKLYEDLTDGGTDRARDAIEQMLRTNGLAIDDPRLQYLSTLMQGYAQTIEIPFEAIAPALSGTNQTLLSRALTGNLVIPDFAAFCAELEHLFAAVRECREGDVASYIPQLASADADGFAMAVCTVDGQRFAIGDTDARFGVQSTCKPINYALALDRLGIDAVHRHVGREPSGHSFNEITLNAARLPHNPMINAGAIMCASLIAPDLSAADRFDSVFQTWKALAGAGAVGFDNAVFLSERDTADRNFALAYFMRENGAFPDGTDLKATLELYFQCCSITIDAPGLATVAATFASGGVCPLTSERVFSGDTTKNCLSLMASCGLYDFSGEFAFTVGLPAKSGVSGALFLTIPGVCGIALWSPRLDALGNSVRGVEFARRLTKAFNFDSFADGPDAGAQTNPRRRSAETIVDQATYFCAAAAKGDLTELRRLMARSIDVNLADYDGRTALHLAAGEGRADVLRYLLSRGADRDLSDRWGNTALVDAQRNEDAESIALLQTCAISAVSASKARRGTKVLSLEG
ncbi:glutaminase A [Sphingomonas sp. 22R3R2A-7]|uniref:glutaminase A n=1 Tax=Sphingomonas sp. 22R3R2A-7 TaxID=3050230 RepID=UPI002FE18C60